jgi:hypothetical protein
VPQAGNAAEFWYVHATAPDTALLRETLVTLARRESDGFPFLPVYVQASDSDVIGWLLRDFTEVSYIQHPSEARAQAIALLPASSEPPDLRGSYVGQDFVIKRIWRLESLRGLDFLSWWMQRRTRAPAVRAQTMVLWLRQDIYDGVEFDFAG